MKDLILSNLNNPLLLEKMYRENRSVFKREFNLVYPDIRESVAARVWHERLNYESDEISFGTNAELFFVILISFLAGTVAKLPDLISVSQDFFYPRNIAFVVFPFLTLYFMRKHQMEIKKIVAAGAAFVLSAVYINLLPDNNFSDTLILACIHLPLFLWSVLGYAFTEGRLNDLTKRIDFLRYNGDLLVMMAVITIAAALFTAITFGLFSLIGLNIEKFYFDYVVVWGAASIPVVGTYLVRTNPQLVSKVSPVIAKVFTPLVLVNLVVYLIAVLYTGKDPYNDREFLMIFNLLLIGVMAIILFSVAETSKNYTGKLSTFMLLALSVVTIIVNGIALSAIVFRISEWGITPNRMAVLGGNVLMLVNLLMVTWRLLRVAQQKNEMKEVSNTIAAYLPVYTAWTLVVVFLFPLVFGMK